MIEEGEAKQAGDFKRFLKSQRGQGVLEDTGGYVYHFKRVIHKRNHFGKVCRCTVWRCKHYKRFNCPCNVHTYGQTIIGSNRCHNHTASQDGSRIELNEQIVQEATGTDKSANTISAELLHKYRMRLRTPQLESVKRSVRRARQHYRKRLHSNTPPQKVPKPKKKQQPSLPDTNLVPEPDQKAEPKPTRTPTIEDFPILKDIDTLKEVLELLHEMSDQNISSDLSSFDLPTSSTPFSQPSTTQELPAAFDPPAVPISHPSHSGHPPLGNDGTQISFELPPKAHKFPKIDIPLPTSFVPNRTIDDVRPSIIIPDLTPSLPSKSEFKILSDQVALQNILNLLKLTNSVPNNITTAPMEVIPPKHSHDCASHAKCDTTPDSLPTYNCAVNQCDPPVKRRRRKGPNKEKTASEPPKKRGRSKKPFKYIPPNMSDPCPNATAPLPGSTGSRGSTPMLPHSTVPTSVQDTPCISLIPISQSTSNLENSKLLKAVPIGNGLYRLEEPDQGMAQVMSRESVYQAAAPTGSTEVTASVYTPSTNSVNFDHVGMLPQISPKPTAIEQPSIFSPQRGDNLFSPSPPSNLFSSSMFEPSIFSLLQKAQQALQGQLAPSSVSLVPSTTSILSSLAALVSHSNQTSASNQSNQFNSKPAIPSNLAPLPAHLRSINTSTQPRLSQPVKSSFQPLTVEQQTESLMKLLKYPSTNILSKSTPPVVNYTLPTNLAQSKSKRRNNSRGLEMSLDSFDLTDTEKLNNSLIMSATNVKTTTSNMAISNSVSIADKTAEVLQPNQMMLRSANLENH